VVRRLALALVLDRKEKKLKLSKILRSKETNVCIHYSSIDIFAD